MKKEVLYLLLTALLLVGFGYFNWMHYQATHLLHSPEVMQAFQLAGDNREELEKVFDHYSRHEADSLKLSAAEFLISNMSGFYSADPQLLQVYDPFYRMYDSIDIQYHGEMPEKRIKQIDTLWKDFRQQAGFDYRQHKQFDVENISGAMLIREIELAFKAWQGNVYTRDCSFSDFCEYILPYRRANGLLVDSARHVFYERHKERFFTGKKLEFIDEADSLLYLYRDIKHSQFAGSSIPIFDAFTLERLQRGLCEQRCWYNSILFSSLGMASTIDYVPWWGNRNGAHSWNTLIVGGQSYAFEPFWDEDRWKYKRIYNNESFDEKWGRFRLPKVYRNTYSSNPEGPITDSRIDRNNIPELFKILKKKDVSHEYFETSDVAVTLEGNIPPESFYAYLCVFNSGKWVPVQWGEIKHGKATFKAMGRDIVYLPAFFENGVISQAGKPFLLTMDGSRQVLEPGKSGGQLSVRYVCGAYEQFRSMNSLSYMAGAVVTGSIFPDFDKPDTLCSIPEKVELYTGQLHFPSKKSRYIRIKMHSDTLALTDLSFFEESVTGLKQIEGISFISNMQPSANKVELPEFIFDKYLTTGYKSHKPLKYVDIDLGNTYNLSMIKFTPYTDIEFTENSSWKLLYWDHEWKVLQTKQASNGHVVFDNVPANALFIVEGVKNNTIASNRIFINNDGIPKWY